MEYKGYAARPIAFDAEENTFSGTVAGLKDVIHVEGPTARNSREPSAQASTVISSFCGEGQGQRVEAAVHRPFSR
jgi:predicted HicB family RNase H-like nuclease